ncbi:hypothetical protein A3860_38110 [Niastella vici]|uniref:DUF3823 domain-containing protein n=1 Tax=Niastella vici TaxID=1703345 RepID=A0A1V9FLP5_9BACT|nr:DUF3823 domain-containing protein [Niastella vici]OQP59272.1 hypothetical protein A3860_38110 [Niastella vici]
MKYCMYTAIALIITTIASCKKDNYKAPNSKLTGHITYKGDPIEVEYNQVQFELYQYGFGKIGPVAGTFQQDGSYSMLLFNGEYKFIIPNGQGPFKWKQTAAGAPDTTVITLNGSQDLNIEVTPYYMVRNPKITAAGGNILGNFKVEKIITDASAKDVESVSLYLNKTQFVSGADNTAVTTVDAAAITDWNNVQLSVAVPSGQSSVYARIGVKIVGVEDRLFSPVTKLSF